MAEKTEFLQAIDDAILDADSLERFINGSDSETVLTRLSAKYPTLQKALKDLFENGGLSATPFNSLSELQSSDLSENSYAVVINDADESNNRFYTKKSGFWQATSGQLATSEQLDLIKDALNSLRRDNLLTSPYVKAYLGRVTDLVSFPDGVRQYVIRSGGGVSYEAKVEAGNNYSVVLSQGEIPDILIVGLFKQEPEPMETYSEEYTENPLIVFESEWTASDANVTNVRKADFSVPDGYEYAVITVSLKGVAYTAKLFNSDIDIDSIHEVPSINSIRELPFLIEKSNNLFDGLYHQGLVSRSLNVTDEGNLEEGRNGNIGRYAIIPVKPNQEYSIYSAQFSELDRFRVATSPLPPSVKDGTPVTLIYDEVVHGIPKDTCKVVTPSDARFMAISVTLGTLEPDLVVMEGSPDNIREIATLHRSVIPRETFLSHKSGNLFDGHFLKWKVDQISSNELQVTEDDTEKSMVAFIPIKPNTAYSISVGDTSSETLLVYEQKDVQGLGVTEGQLLSELSIPKTLLVEPKNYSRALLIVGSIRGYTRKIMVVEGIEGATYKPQYVISPEYLPADISSSGGYEGQDQFVRKELFQFNVDLNVFYKRNRPLENYFEDPVNTNYTDIIAKYDELMASLPEGYMTKQQVGADVLGNPLYEYETNPTDIYLTNNGQGYNPDASTVIRPPKFVIISGTHGDEKTAVYGVLYALKDIFENPTEDVLLDFISRRVKLVVLPVCNPSGFNTSTRHNANGVDINRDFPPTNTPSQPEAIAMVERLTSHVPFDYCLDAHTASGASKDRLGYVITTDKELQYAMTDMYQEMGRSLQKQYPQIDQNKYKEWVYAGNYTNGTHSRFVELVLKRREVTLETRNTLLNMSTENYHEEMVVVYSELVLNSLINFLKLLQKGN